MDEGGRLEAAVGWGGQYGLVKQLWTLQSGTQRCGCLMLVSDQVAMRGKPAERPKANFCGFLWSEPPHEAEGLWAVDGPEVGTGLEAGHQHEALGMNLGTGSPTEMQRT